MVAQRLLLNGGASGMNLFSSIGNGGSGDGIGGDGSSSGNTSNPTMLQANVMADVVDVSGASPSPPPQPGVPEIMYKKQVFNIPGNQYTFTDAKAVCKAYGARLATYEEMEEAYNNGAEWCNYGWSQGQMAYFPTQSKTFNELQKINGHQHDCGRPGINGGFIANPNVRFGANCYGNKPEITTQEEDLMKNSTIYPESQEDKMMQERVQYYQSILPSILVSPFNHSLWTKLI